MADIKPDKLMEKPLSWNEKNLPTSKSLEEIMTRGVEVEKMKNIEEARKNVIDEIGRAESAAPAAVGPVGGIAVPQAGQQKKIESVLASGLEDIYVSLAPEKQKEFRRVGEETAGKINKLLAKAKINIGEIIRLIKKWLSLIPGVNKYFLEQEAKIKAEEIIKMRQKNK